MSAPLFHGMAKYQFDTYYSNNANIPSRWTTGPLEALSYAFTYWIDHPLGILIWEVQKWSEENFAYFGEGLQGSIMPELKDKELAKWMV